MRTIVAALVAGLALTAPFAARGEDQITNPDWVHRPSAADLRGVWPTEALRKGQGGLAVIGCEVSVQGLLFNCKVVHEEPEGAGFGAAAILMAPQFIMRPQTRNGVPLAGGHVRIPIRFEGSGSGGYVGESRPVVRPNMAWERAPTRAEVAAAYPAKAKAEGVGGVVSLQCGFTYQRTLTACRTLAEVPRGYGFDKAAREVSRSFVALPDKPGGRPLSEAGIQLSIAFTPALLNPDVDVGGKPNWARLPDEAALNRAFANMPADVASVRVVLRCTVEQGGSLSGCRTTAEEPAGQGLGERALALVPGFGLSTWSMEGLPVVGGQVNIPLRYKRAEPAAAAK